MTQKCVPPPSEAAGNLSLGYIKYIISDKISINCLDYIKEMFT